MDDREAYEYYLDPGHRKLAGRGRKRKAQRLTSMTSVRFAPEVIEAVKVIAFGEGVTVGSWIRRLIQREIAEPRPQAGADRPAGLIPGSGRKGDLKALRSSLGTGNGAGRSFACPHMSIGNVQYASCGVCGPMAAVA